MTSSDPRAPGPPPGPPLGPELEPPTELLDLEEIYDDATLELIEARDQRGAYRGPVGTMDARSSMNAGGSRNAGGTRNPEGAAVAGPTRSPSPGPARVGGIRGAVLAGAMFGVAEVLEPDPEKQAVIEFAPEQADHHDDPVEFVFVYGAPSRSRIIFRPWLGAPHDG